MSELLLNLLPTSLVFDRHRHSYFKVGGGQVAPRDERAKTLVDTLNRDGVIVIPDFIQREKALALGQRLKQASDALPQADKPRVKALRFDDEGLVRTLNAEDLDPEAREFFEDPLIENVAKSYACTNVVSWQRMFEERMKKWVIGGADWYHIDEAFYFKFKAFLYLTDVTLGTAPYMYIKGTHLSAPWRQPKELQILKHDIYGPEKVFGNRGNFFVTGEVRHLTKTLGHEVVTCCGPAGSLVLTDTRGVHKATTPNSGGRLMLGHYFELPRKNIWPPTRKNSAL